MADEKIIIEVEVKGEGTAKKEIDEVKKSTKDAAKEQKEYNKSLVDSAKDVKLFGVSVNSLTTAMSGAKAAIIAGVQSLRVFKVALAATGIGLLVIALGSLYTFFTRSQEGSEKLSKALRVIGNVVSVILDRISDLGSAIFKLFTGDFVGAAETAKAAFTGIGEAISENIKRATELEERTIALAKAQVLLTVQEAKYRKEIAESREVMNDQNNLLEERIAAGRRAMASEMALSDARQRQLKEQIAIAKEALNESKTLTEDLQKVADLEAQLIDVQTNRARASIRITSQLRTLEDQQRKETLREVEAFEAEKVLEYQNTAKIQIDTSNIVAQTQKDNAKEVAEYEKAINKEKAAAILAESAGLFGSLAGLIGQNSIFGKAAAIAEATINTWVAGTSALKDTPGGPIIKGIALAATIATGLATVKRIIGVQLPQVQPVESSFADGGMIRGKSHKDGGVNINAEGGEYIISKDRMRLPHVRRAAMALNNHKQSKQRSYKLGGFVNQDPTLLMAEAMRQMAKSRPVLVTNDLYVAEQQNRVSILQSTLQ